MIVQTPPRALVDSKQGWTARLALPLILLAAALPRFFGLGWDGGQYAHPDELHIVDVTVNRLHMPEHPSELLDPDSSPMNPRRIQPHPADPERLDPSGRRYSYSYGTLLVYLLKAVSNLFSGLAGERFARFDSIYMVGRALSALADTGTVLLLYALGARLFGRRTGLLAAAFSAFAVLQVQYSHYYVAEPMMTMFLTLALFFIARALTGASRLSSLGAGVALGLAVATKPSAAAFLVSGLGILFAGALLSRPNRALPRRLAWALAARHAALHAALAAVGAFAAWAIFEPYALLDLRTYIENIGMESKVQSGALDYPFTRQYIGTIPGWYHLSQYARWSLGIPLGAAALAGLAWSAWSVIRRRDPRCALLLAWVAPYSLSILTLEAKWLRYMLPLTPVLLLLAAASLWRWHDHVRSLKLRGGPLPTLQRNLALLLMAAVLTGSALWTFAFTRVYASPHTWASASEWIYANVAAGSTLGVEHWDRSLPIALPSGDPGLYDYESFELYNDLPPEQKLKQIRGYLRSADYVILGSNRLYGSIPRSPWRYAVATRYYDLLFGERLGFRKVAEFAQTPRLGPLGVDERGADESFTVYDHPKVIVFKKERALQAWEYDALFADSLRAPWSPERHGVVDKTLRLRPLSDPAVTGGPYFEGAAHTGWTAALFWLFVLEALGALAWVFLQAPLHALPDAGWVLSKGLGILLISWLAWALASWGVLPAGQATVLFLALALLLAAATVALVRRDAMLDTLRGRWRAILGFECLFLLLFATGALLRAANPDLWQPYFGGEKPMELTFINGILRSSELPPYDPWFSGGYINYYYFGQWIAATLMRLSAVGPQYGFNLAVATVWALTGALAASIGFAVARGSGRLARVAVAGLSLLFVLLLGNLDGGVQALQALRAGRLGSLWEGFDFWRSTRVIGGTINEFPFFTFLYGDLHAHMIAMPLGLSLVLLGAYLVLGGDAIRGGTVYTLSMLAGLLAGALATTNPWDVPAYSGLFLLALLVSCLRARESVKARVARLGISFAVFLSVAVGGFLPFFLNFKSFYSSVGLVTTPTRLQEHLGVLGLFMFVAAWHGIVRSWRSETGRRLILGVLALWVLGVSAGQAVLALLVGLLALTLYTLWLDRGAPHAAVWAGLTAGGLLIWAGIEKLYLKDFLAGSDWYRQNTVFKFGLQSWMLLALGCAGLLYLALRASRTWPGRIFPLTFALALIAASSIYPVYGSADRLRWRFPEPPPGVTLDGEVYMKTATLATDSGNTERLEYDYLAIEWLRRNVDRPHTIAEAGIGPYRGNGSRVSMFTGLPAVVGWANHEKQQRYPDEVSERNRELRELYDSPDIRRALEVISRYGIKYIYVGPVERMHEYPSRGEGLPPDLYASPEGLAKFERMTGYALRVAYRNPGVTIYEVLPSWKWRRVPGDGAEPRGG